MTTTPSETAAQPSPAEPVVRRRRGPSLVWLIPLVAALIGLWLGYKTLSEKGPTVILTFADGSGLEAGKTKVRYKAVEVGVVETMRLSEDLRQVEVTATLSPSVEDHLGEGARFWVQRPRVGLGGVSGLETLLSGPYIAFEPGASGFQQRFVGLEAPPAVRADESGRSFLLHASALGALQVGTPVQYHGVVAGEVTRYQLGKDSREIEVQIFVREPFDRFVREDSRFWRTQALDFSLGAQGVELRLGSLGELLAGGIAFDTPEAKAAPAEEGHGFRLFDSQEGIREASYLQRVPMIAYFQDSVRGLSVGAPVEFRGIQVGKVTDIRFAADDTARIAVLLEFTPERFGPREESIEAAYANIEQLVERGLRARLRSGNLLTGQFYVNLEFQKSVPPQTLGAGNPPVIPTLPSLASEAETTLAELAAKLRALPLDQIAEELLGAAHGVNRLANSPELVGALRELDATLKELRKLAGSLDTQLVRLGGTADKTLGAARTTLQLLDSDSPLMSDLSVTLEELAAAARSLRELADYLSRYPESLLYGKGGKER